jgi:hypothetical protein
MKDLAKEKVNGYVVIKYISTISELQCSISIAKVIVPDWGIKLTPAWGFRTGPPGYIGRQADTMCPFRKRVLVVLVIFIVF